MGATSDNTLVSRDPIVDLIAQVNRFTRAGQFGGKIYPLEVATGNLTEGVTRTAIIIHQTRLLTAQAAIPDPGTAAAVASAAAGLAKPVEFVAKHLAAITASVAGYADIKGMPAADYHKSGGPPAGGGISTTMLAIGAGAIALVWFLSTKKSR